MWSLNKRVDARQVEQAIREAERATTGEIRVSVAHFFWGNVPKVAARAFRKLGMERTTEHNGVLIFLVPSRRRFVVLGDSGIHAVVGQAFWDEVAACLGGYFQRGEFTEGLLAGIHLLGVRLAEHFPAGASERNELGDEVDFR